VAPKEVGEGLWVNKMKQVTSRQVTETGMQAIVRCNKTKFTLFSPKCKNFLLHCSTISWGLINFLLNSLSMSLLLESAGGAGWQLL